MSDPVPLTLRPDYSGVTDARGRPAGHLVALRCAGCHRVLHGAVVAKGGELFCRGCV